MEAEMIWRRQPIVQNPFQSCLRREWLYQFFESCADLIHIVRYIGAEQATHDDFQREPHHVSMNVARFAFSPRCNQPLRILDHGIRVRRDSVAMESAMR